MIGTILNVVAIVAGGALGLLFGARLPERIRTTAIAGMGLFTAVIGIHMTFKTQELLVVLGSLLIGGVVGEWWRIEDRLRSLGAFFESRFSGPLNSGSRLSEPRSGETSFDDSTVDSPAAAVSPDPAQPAQHGSRFIRGFLTASLVYAIGPMAILGSIQDGLTGDFSLLAVKSILDGFASLAFASSLGVGVLFSSAVILVYQGGISLLAAQAEAVFTTSMMNEMTAVGGVLLLGVAISGLLEIKPIRVGNLLPSLAVAPIIVAVLTALNFWK